MIKKILMTFTCSSFLSLTSFANYSLKEMTLEEKAGQLLITHFHGEEANENAEILIQKVKVGGFIYYNWANGLNSPQQVLSLSTGLQKLTKQNRVAIPLFIAVDQEGGIVARLSKGFTIFPGNTALGMSGDPDLAEKSAIAIGSELRAVGVNFNLSPVVDVNSNPRNPVIGIRSFGDTTDIVVPFAKRAVQGYHQVGIITSLKHFPGHGDVEVDSHEDLPIIKKSKQELQKVEFLPFSEMAHQADTVMTAHVIVPSIDPINCATLSKSVLDILRNEMKFNGAIISDSLVMEGLLKNCSSIDDAAIRAINAGCDILCLGGKQLNGNHANLELTVSDIQRIHRNIVAAVKNGIISEERLNEAVQRVLNLKNKYNLTVLHDEQSSVNLPANQELAKEISKLALRTIGNNQLTYSSLHQMKLAVFAPDIVKENINQTSLLKLGRETSSLFFKGLNPNINEIQAAKTLAQESDILIFCSYNAWKNNTQAALIKSLIGNNKPFILISLRDALDANLFPEADIILTTYSPTIPSIQAACERLFQSDLK